MEDLTLYSKEELVQIQKIELEALKQIVKACDSLHIEYFLIGGTALGAVRHDGFIPWDDDIDIGMTRNNYNRFIREAQALLPEEYTIQSPETDRHSPYFYTKVRIDGTIFMEYCNRNLKIHHGVYVDIFPFDNVPDNEHEYTKHFNGIQHLIRIFNFRQTPDVSEAPHNFIGHVKQSIRHIIHHLSRIISFNHLYGALYSKFTKYNSIHTKAITCYNFPKIKTEYILRSDLYPLKLHRFEDTEFAIPSNFDTYLKTHYGDYMQLPSPEKRFGHKPYRVKIY